MSELPEKEETVTEYVEEADIKNDHSEVWGGTTEISPEGEEFDVDFVQDDYEGKLKESELVPDFGLKETGGEENPLEVQGYDPLPSEVETENAEVFMERAATSAYIPAGESTLIAETVLGRDDRVRIWNTRPFPWRTICYLEITAADGRKYIGTGNFIGPHTVMTAGHCVFMHSHGGWVRSIKVIPGANGNVAPFGFITATRFVSVRGWTSSASPNYDYGAIILRSNTLGNRVGWMGYAALRYINLIRLRINNSGYPGDKPAKTQWWNCNRIVWVSYRRVYYIVDTAGGQSGSPVWRYMNNRRHQVAIHAYGGQSANSGVRITRPVFDNITRWRR